MAQKAEKQRQTPHRSGVAKPEPARAGQPNRRRERRIDAARHPKKYYVAKRLVETETPAHRVTEPSRRRPRARVSRAPAPKPGVRVRDVMVGDVVTIHIGATLLDAARLMREANVGMLPVLEGGRLCGVLTDRDLVVRAMAAGVAPGAAAVRDHVTIDVVAATPDWPVDTAMETMATRQVGRLPVTDDTGRIVGMVTLGSLVLRAREDEQTVETAKEVTRRSARRRAA